MNKQGDLKDETEEAGGEVITLADVEPVGNCGDGSFT